VRPKRDYVADGAALKNIHGNDWEYCSAALALAATVLVWVVGRSVCRADPWPTDWLPRFNKVRIDEHGIVFDAAVTQIRLRDGQWGNAAGSPINTMVQKQNIFVPRSTECSVPQEVLSHYKNEYREAEVLYCDLPDRAWFATGGYCGEGDEEPKLNQGHLYSYSAKSGKVREYPGFLPRCAELAGLVRINNKLVVVTLYQEEYSQVQGRC